MKRVDITYGELDRVLRSFGFTCRLHSSNRPPAKVYEHKKSGAVFMLPPFPDDDQVFAYHLVAIRGQLDNFGIASPKTIAGKLPSLDPRKRPVNTGAVDG